MHNNGMIYGYARVSADAQDLAIQLAQLKAMGCEKITNDHLIAQMPRSLVVSDGSTTPWVCPWSPLSLCA